MSQYLRRIAHAFVERYGNGVSRMCFVFPNRRASLFFRRYLSDGQTSPMLSPQMLTLGDLFASLASQLSTPLRRIDNTSLLFRLYRIYVQINPEAEPFEQFIYWERVLLSDFNEIDTHLVDAKRLLTNVEDLHQIDMILDRPSRLIERQRTFWSYLYPMYNALRLQLQSEGLAYEGMLQRAVAEQLATDSTLVQQFDKVVFVGFNALTPVEETMLTAFRNEGRGDYYWDYTAPLLSDNENNASLFAEHNTSLFPSQLEVTMPAVDLQQVKIQQVETMTDVEQTLAVSSMLESLYPSDASFDESALIDTVVVLPDEKMLLPQMYAIPEQIRSVNVTMGYPLSYTQVFSFVKLLLDLQTTVRTEGERTWFYSEPLLALLLHPCLSAICEVDTTALVKQITEDNMVYVPSEILADIGVASEIFTVISSPVSMLTLIVNMLRTIIGAGDRMMAEFAYRYLTIVNRLQDIWTTYSDVTSSLSMPVLSSMLSDMTSMVNVAFEGEPLSGLQIMGVLETRTLDFENLIVTSVNDEVFPQKNNTQSFVSQQLRRAFGMPTAERAEAITAYNFFRMLSHAKRVWLITNVSSGDNKSGEVSRYLLQLRHQYHLSIPSSKVSTIAYDANADAVEVPKTEMILRRLDEYLSAEGNRGLSPSALNTYLSCGMRFCLTYLLGYRQPRQMSQFAEAEVFGTVFHAIMEHLYEPFIGREVTAPAIQELLKATDYLKRVVAEIYVSEMYNGTRTRQQAQLGGIDVLTQSVLLQYVKCMLQFDVSQAPFFYEGSEVNMQRVLTLSDGRKVLLTGKIDRIDQQQSARRVIDYKTGGGDMSFSNIEEVFDGKKPYILQTLFYCMLLDADGSADNVEPHIYFLKTLSADNEKKTSTAVHEKDTDRLRYYAYRSQVEHFFDEILSEMLDPEKPFTQAKDTKPCRFCHLAALCPNMKPAEY